MQIDRSTAWIQTAAVPVRFATFHPQGMVKVGPEFFVSAVEIKQYPARLAGAPGGRSPGAGVGHLFRMSADGALLGSSSWGRGTPITPAGSTSTARICGSAWRSTGPTAQPSSTASIRRP
uniref:Uncharacterized protein n=1 Tax=Phenylobacterium glaciei TaxID=2803784 RepID=A0A974P345_9CAUL|nr:hypothetical protein JKL49_01035 [Phenylobacterium glaciei]